MEIIDKIKKLQKDDFIYSPICGIIKVYDLKICQNDFIMVKNKNGAAFVFDKCGYYVGTSIKEAKIFKSNECLLFPSEQMRNWDKLFCKGDALKDYSGIRKGIFYGYKDNTKQYPIVCYIHTVMTIKDSWSYEESSLKTENWCKIVDCFTDTNFINSINEYYGINFDRYNFVRPNVDTKVRDSKVDEMFQKLDEDPILMEQFMKRLTGGKTPPPTLYNVAKKSSKIEGTNRKQLIYKINELKEYLDLHFTTHSANSYELIYNILNEIIDAIKT